MTTIADKAVIVLTASLIFVFGGGIAMKFLHPHLGLASVICLIILLAAVVVAFRELRALSQAAGLEKKKQKQRAGQSGWMQTPVRAERRSEAIELRPQDSVDQIARLMVAASFRQASAKYHSDHGGSDDLMGRVVQARAVLLSALSRY